MSSTSDTLKICLLRIKSGESFIQATRDLSFPIAERSTRNFASEIFKKILNHSLPAYRGVEALRDHILIKERSRKLLHSKTQMPKLQCRILAVLGIGMIAILHLILPPDMQPGALLSSVALSMILGAFFWNQQLARSLEKHFWFSEWVQILSFWRAQLSCGQTFVTAVSNSQEFNVALPQGLQTYCSDNLKKLMSGDSLHLDKRATAQKTIPFHLESQEQMRILFQQAEKGYSLSELLDDFILENQTAFQLFISEESEKTQIKMMLPLLGLILPAFWVLLFGPLLTRLLSV